MKANFIISIVLTLFSTLPVFSQTKEFTELQKAVAVANAECPISLGAMGMVESIEMSEENIVWDINADIFTTMLDPALVAVDSTTDYESVYTTLFSVGFATEPAMIQLMELLSKCDMGMIFELHAGGKSLCKFSIPKKMIDEILTHEPNYKEYVKTIVEITNSKCPIEMGPMSQKNMEIIGGKVITNIIVDENQLDFNSMAGNESFIKTGLIEMLRNNSEPVSCLLMKNTALAGYSTMYKYIGSTDGKEIAVEITPEEVVETLQMSPAEK